MHFLRAYRFAFDSPHWLPNVGFVSLCLLSAMVIPVIGQLLLLGYLFEVVEAMHRQASDRRYPDFVWERFVPYLVRGVWVFLVQLVVTLPLSLLLAGLLLGIFAVVAASGGLDEPAVVAMVVTVVVAVALVFTLLLGVVLVPLSLRAGLCQDFAASFAWDFLRDFVQRMWWETVLVQFFLLVGGLVLGLVGLLACCIGVFPAAALQSFAQHHLYYQLYELYLERGGMPIPLKEELTA